MKRLLCPAFILAAVQPAFARNFPARPIKLVVGFAPGGGVDINARMLAPKLAEYLGQQVVVENKPGAGTNIANEFVAKSPADGYTLLINTAALAINMSLYPSLPFDTLRDFAPISVFSESPNVLVVNAKLPVSNVKDLLELARKSPGKLNYSSAGVGTTQHLSAELLKMLTRTFIVHIPYRGTSPSLTGLIAGEVDLTFANIPAIQAHVKSGRLRALATTGTRRDARSRNAQAHAGTGRRPGRQHAGGIQQAAARGSRALGDRGEDFRSKGRLDPYFAAGARAAAAF